MKKISLLFSLLFTLLLITACSLGGNNPPDDDIPSADVTYRVMVAVDEGFSVKGTNPVDVKKGDTVSFNITIDEGYVFSSASAGIYNENTGILTVENVTERMNITFVVEKLDYDPNQTFAYIFKGKDGDFTSTKSSSAVNAGTLITVTSAYEEQHFVGWSFGKSLISGGELVSTERIFKFRLTPSIVTDGTLYVYANYTDANVYYYDLNGGALNINSHNMRDNEYYTLERVQGMLKVTLSDVYYRFAECASLFWDDGTFSRPGYVLKEYNTKPDGSGEGYSLGSKFYTVSDGGLAILYCIWEKAESASEFAYSEISMPSPVDKKYAPDWRESGVAITSYKGNFETVTVPEEIGGKPVISIASGAFVQKQMKTLVLPKTLQKIEDGAFSKCSSLNTVYFPDSVFYISDGIFDADTYSNFKTLIMNATMAPRYSNGGDGAFSVKLSRLMAARGEKKIVVISGSSTYQGLGSEYFESLMDGEYTVVNFGTTRTRPGAFYLEAMSHYTSRDDIIIYAPENSAFMMGETYLNYRMLYEVESMYNLYRYVDISNYYGYFSSLGELNSQYKYARVVRAYEDICKVSAVNKYGDYQNANRQQYEYAKYLYDVYYITFNNRYKSIFDGMWNDVEFQKANKDYTDPSNTTWKSIDDPKLVAQMNHAIASAKSSGAKVYFGFCPADADAVVEEARNEAWLKAYDKMIADNYDFDGFIGTSQEYIFNHKYFYDCAFHLNDYGRTYRTYKLYLDVCEVLGITATHGIYDVGTDFEGCLFEEGSDGTPLTKVDYLN